MRHRLVDVHVVKYPVLCVTFEDGLSGELDLSEDIAKKPMFAELKKEDYFRRVKLNQDGNALGWKLDQVFQEIDLSADGIRTDIETQLVIQAAARHRAKRQAAE